MAKLAWIFAACCVLTAAEDGPDKDKVVLPTTAEDLATGKRLYLGGCTYCHGPTGDGGKGADLARAELSRAKTDADLLRIIENGIPGTEMPGAWHMTRREMMQTASFVRTLGRVEIKALPGDKARGEALYAKQGCAACHTTKQGNQFTGGLVGPDLSAIGLRRSAGHLRESILDPEASTPENYRFVRLLAKNGKRLEGRLVHEDTFVLAIRDAAGNNIALQKSDLREMTKDRKKSLMPSYKQKLSPSELDDLVSYLASLREAQ